MESVCVDQVLLCDCGVQVIYTSLERHDFTFPSRNQLQITSRLRVGICVYFLFMLWFYLIWTCTCHLCTVTVSDFYFFQPCYVWMIICPQSHLPPLALNPPFLQRSNNLERKGFDKDILFSTEYSKVAYSLHIVQLWFSVLITTYCKNRLLWWGFSDSLSVQQNSNRGNLAE